MTSNNLIAVRNIFRNKMKHARIEIIEEVMLEKCIKLDIIPNFLTVYISGDDITISYEEENDEFWKVTYSTTQAWVNAASKHAITIATHTIVSDSYYNKLTGELLYYKIWIIEENNRRRLLKRVSKTSNPVNLFIPKAVITKVLKESKQK